MKQPSLFHHLLRGFTLVELLVVISIIGMMSALALPAMRTAVEKAKTAKCVGNLRGIGSAVQQYIADPVNNHQFPPIYNAGASGGNAGSASAPSAPLAPLVCLEQYGATKALLTCPSDHDPDPVYGSYQWSPVLQGEQPEDVHIYTPGGIFTVNKLSKLMVCCDNGRPHLGKINILRADGHVDTWP